MARTKPQPRAEYEEVLECLHKTCPACGTVSWNQYDNYRTIRTLKTVVQLRLKVRRCPNANCQRFHQAYRPEAESRWALPQHEFGLDVVALVGAIRYQDSRTIPEIHQILEQKGLCISQRSVSHLLERYDELVATRLTDNQRLRELLQAQGRVILAIDGMQPDVGHEVLWVIRDCLSGEILLATALLSATHQSLAKLLDSVKTNLEVPIVAVVSDGQGSIGKAVEVALSEAVHGLCHYHYLKEAAKDIYEADRHAKKELKKRVRGIRAIEYSHEDAAEPMSEVVQDYCQAVRAALSEDGRAPLAAPGLKLQQRLGAIEQSLERLGQKGGNVEPWPSSSS